MSNGVDDQQVGAMTSGAGFPTCYVTLTGLVPLQTGAERVAQSCWPSARVRVTGRKSRRTAGAHLT